MAEDRTPPAPDRLPTLTEVLELGPAAEPDPAPVEPMPQPAAGTDNGTAGGADLETAPTFVETGRPAIEEVLDGVVAPPAVAHDAEPAAAEAALLQRVQAELTLRFDAMLEERLREALAPALARAADGLIRDLRSELAPVLRDLAAEAVRQLGEGPTA